MPSRSFELPLSRKLLAGAVLGDGVRRFTAHDDPCIERTRAAQGIGDQAGVLRSLEQLACFDGVCVRRYGKGCERRGASTPACRRELPHGV